MCRLTYAISYLFTFQIQVGTFIVKLKTSGNITEKGFCCHEKVWKRIGPWQASRGRDSPRPRTTGTTQRMGTMTLFGNFWMVWGRGHPDRVTLFGRGCRGRGRRRPLEAWSMVPWLLLYPTIKNWNLLDRWKALEYLLYNHQTEHDSLQF